MFYMLLIFFKKGAFLPHKKSGLRRARKNLSCLKLHRFPAAARAGSAPAAAKKPALIKRSYIRRSGGHHPRAPVPGTTFASI